MEDKAIVISEDHYNALGVIRSLGEKKIPVILILTTKPGHTYTNKSKYVTEVIFADHDQKKIIEEVKKLCKNQERYFIFPLSDFSAMLIDQNYTLFDKNVVCPNMKGNMMIYQNKVNSKNLAIKCGMKSAKSMILKVSDYAKWSEFPAIIKPLISQEGVKSDITIVDNSQELVEALDKFRTRNYTRVLIEQYLAGKDEHMVEVLGCSFGENVFIAGIIKKIREYPMKRGSTSYAQIVQEHKDIEYETIKQFIKLSQYEGLFDMEFKYVDGRCYFIECNFRNGAPSYAFTLSGCNLPYNWILGKKNKELINMGQENNGLYFMCEQTDFLNTLKREISLKKWLKDFCHCKKIFLVTNDSYPSFVYYMQFIKTMLKRLFRR